MAALSKILRSQTGGHMAFWCPGCKLAHSIPTKPRTEHGWDWNGDAEKPTFNPSIGVNLPGHPYHVPSAFVCHSFVRNGQIEFQTDCTHALASQTVPIPEWPDHYHDGDG